MNQSSEYSLVLSMITRDSAERIGADILSKVITSSLQIPYRTFILVDDSTSEKTRKLLLEFAEKHNKEVVLERSRLYGSNHPTRATARQTAIDIFFENFSEDFIMFLDDDCILNEGWWDWVETSKVLEEKQVGEIWGVNWDVDPTRRKLIETTGEDYLKYLIRAFELRGGTHDTIYRRKALEGVRIPPELHVYEDSWLHHYIRCRGYKWVVNPVGVTHYHLSELLTFKGEKMHLKHAIYVATRYGIVDYDIRGLQRGWLSRVASWLTLLRPIAGIGPALWVHLRVYGVRGVPLAVKKQFIKLIWRYYIIRSIAREIPDVCHAVLNYSGGQQ